MLPGFAFGGVVIAQVSAGGPAAPAQFQTGHWSVADPATGGDITITITTLPSDGGSAITDLEYQIDGGSWVSLAGTTTGAYPVAGLTDDVEVDVAIRAVNAIGNGTASATKAVTPTENALVSEYNNATELTHDWANLTGWISADIQVADNRCHGITASNPAAAMTAFAVGASEHAKVTAEIVRVGGATNRSQYVGFDFNGGVVASLPNFCGVGINTANNRPYAFIGSNFTGVTTGSIELTTTGVTGTVRAIVMIDDENISLVLRKTDGSAEWSHIIPRSAAPNSAAATSIMVWNFDGRGTGTGSYIKAIGAKKSFTPFRTQSNAAGTIEGNTGLVAYRDVDDLWRVHLPAGLSGTTPAPVCIYFPQALTGVAASPMESRAVNVDQALDAAGYIVLSASDNGDGWGNQASLDNFAALLAWVQAKVYCGPVVFLGVSGGALTAWNAITRGDIDAVAIAGICPACDLDALEADATFTASIRTAYSAADNAEFVTNSAGFNPVDSASLSNFTGIGIKFYAASSGDTLVPNTAHIDVFEPMIDDYAAASTIDLSGTSHLDTEQFQGSDLVTFFDTYV